MRYRDPIIVATDLAESHVSSRDLVNTVVPLAMGLCLPLTRPCSIYRLVPAVAPAIDVLARGRELATAVQASSLGGEQESA